VADDETFNGTNSAVGNTTFVGNDPTDGAPSTPDPTDTSPVTDRPHKTITGDILAGDTDVDSPSSSLTVTPGTFATNDGGTVTIQSDGDFTFEPAASTSCTDTSDFFDYTVNDNDSTNPQTDTGRVTIAITGCVWYVNNDDAQGNSGTSAAPFDTLAQAETASNPATPATIGSVFVYDGNNTTLGYTAGFNMNSGEQLIGEAADLVVSGNGGTLHTGDGAKRPQITDTTEDVVNLDDGCTVAGIEVDPTGANSGIAGAAGDTGGGTIKDVRIIDTGVAATAPLFELDGTTGTFNVSDLTVDNTAPLSGQTSGSVGVRLNNAGTVNFAPTGTISINEKGAKGLDATSTNMGAGSVFDDITVAGSGSGGVSLSSTTGTTTLGDGSGTDLNLATTSGAPAALNVATAGTVSVPSGGTADLHADGGPAADITGTSGAGTGFDLDDVDSTNSSGDGINIDGLGTGTFTATSGDITGASGISFDLNGGSGKVSYPGTFGNGSGTTAIDITGRSGGTGVNGVTLSGSISDTNDLGGTINVSSNTGGQTTLSGSSKQANTTGPSSNGTADGLIFNSSDGHTLTLSNGGLDIDTISGKGLEADTSGTITVAGTGNTINTTTGRGLNISNTDIGASDVTFDSISTGTASTGPANGIRLNTTGTAGDLVVTGGNGVTADNTGGTIQHSTGNGIDLRGSHSASLEQMNVSNSGDSGVYDDAGPVQLNLLNVTSNGNAPQSAGNPESGLSYVNNIGTSSVAGTTVTGSGVNNLDWQPTAGTGTLDVTTSKFNSSVSTGVQLVSPNPSTANVELDITGGEIKLNPAEQLVSQAGGSSTVRTDVSGVDMANDAAHVGNFGVEFNSNTTAHQIARLNNSTIKFVGSSAASAVSLNPIQTSTLDATITNNTIGTPGTSAGDVDSGTTRNFGISGEIDDGATAKLDVEGNTVSHTELDGIFIQAVDFNASAPQAHLDLVLKGNTVNTPDANTQGITHVNGTRVESRNDQDTCLDILNNKSSHVGTTAGLDTDFRVRQRDTSVFALEGFAGNGADDTAVSTFITNQNAGSPGTPGQSASATHATSFTAAICADATLP
jgi:hypothetical protein